MTRSAFLKLLVAIGGIASAMLARDDDQDVDATLDRMLDSMLAAAGMPSAPPPAPQAGFEGVERENVVELRRWG